MSYIDRIKVGSATHLIEPTLYAKCDTAAATATKQTAAINNFNLVAGVQVAVKFTVTNTAAVSDLKLQIGTTTAKSIKYRGGNLPSIGTLAANHIYNFVYDGTYWELVGDLDTDTHRPIQVNGTQILDNNTIALNLKNGNNVSITNNNGTVTIAATDTKSFTITANATDGYWDLTGTNGTNAVTYALAPYSSKQSGASFYTGTTNPDGTTRLNYNGYLYASKLYSNGTEVSVSGHNHDSSYVKKTGDIMNGELTLSKANAGNNFGVYVEHTNPNNDTSKAKKVALMIGGATGSGGVYDVTKGKWIVYSDTAGNVTLNGNAANVSGTVAVKHGGTGATTAAAARTNLGLGSIATYNVSNGSYNSSEPRVPLVNNDGVMEIGKYIDFHVDAASTKDYDVRMTATATYLTVDKLIKVPSLTLTSTSAISHILFSRTNWNYITYPNNASSVLAIGYSTGDSEVQQLVITKTGVVRPGANKTESLGTVSYHWKDIYTAAVLGNTIKLQTLNNTTVSTVAEISGLSILPGIAGTFAGCNLGAADRAWAGIYATTFHGTLDGNATNVTGTVATTHGGTGITTYAIGDILYCSAANTLSKLAKGTAGQFLRMGTANVPVWGDGSEVTLNGTATTTPSFYAPTTAGTNGQILMSSGTGAPAWTDTTSITSVGTITSGTWQGGVIASAFIGAHTHNYLPLTGGDVTGLVNIKMAAGAGIHVVDTGNNNLTVGLTVGSGHQNHGIWSTGYAPTGSTFTSDGKWVIYRDSAGDARTQLRLFGAVWNDYAEYRKQAYKITPGRVVIDLDNGLVIQTEQRLMPGAQVVSDTFGFAIGKNDECKTPLAVSGRVLVYPYRNRHEYHAGMAVCSAPNGTVDIMTREEIKEYPDAIVGIVSEIPQYEEWGENPVEVDGRIWIKVK